MHSPRKGKFKSLPPGPRHVTLFGYRIFTEVTNLKQGHKSGPWSNMTGVLIKRRNLNIETDMSRRTTQRGWYHLKRGIMLLEAKECLGLPGAGRGRILPTYPCFRGIIALQTPWFKFKFMGILAEMLQKRNYKNDTCSFFE